MGSFGFAGGRKKRLLLTGSIDESVLMQPALAPNG